MSIKRRLGWVAVEVLEPPPFPPRPDEVRVRITEVDGQTFTTVVRRSDLRLHDEWPRECPK